MVLFGLVMRKRVAARRALAVPRISTPMMAFEPLAAVFDTAARLAVAIDEDAAGAVLDERRGSVA